MTSTKKFSFILTTSPWIPAVLLFACIVSFVLSFFVPAFLEWQLATARMESGGEVLPNLIRLGLMVLALIFVLWFVMAKTRQRPSFDALFGLSFLTIFSLLLLPNFLAPNSPGYKAVSGASRALLKMTTTEQALGRDTPMGDELRASMVSLEVVQQNQELIDRINDASARPIDALEIMAVASLLGSDHPVIQFTANNGLVADNAREVLYRDLTNHIRQRPDLANDANTSAMLMRLSAR